MCVCSLWNISLMNRFQMCLLCVKLPSFLCGTRPKTSAAQTRFHFIHWMIEKLAQNKQPSEEFFRIIYIFKSQCVHFFISPQKCVRNDTHRLKPLKKRVLMEQLYRTPFPSCNAMCKQWARFPYEGLATWNDLKGALDRPQSTRWSHDHRLLIYTANKNLSLAFLKVIKIKIQS